jgi:hypothetical protein
MTVVFTINMFLVFEIVMLLFLLAISNLQVVQRIKS